MPTELPLDALEMALWVRDRAGHDLAGVIHHSDAGSQYVAPRYTERLADAGALASIGTVGDSYGNALAESIIGLYKTECIGLDGPFRTTTSLSSPPCPGCTGTTSNDCAAPSATSHRWSSSGTTTVRSTPDSTRWREKLAVH